MRPVLCTLAALSLALPTSVALPGGSGDAFARSKHYNGHNRSVRCRSSKGTTGLIVGGVGGAVVGSKVIGHGVVGAGAGAVGGALAGRAIDRSITRNKRCR